MSRQRLLRAIGGFGRTAGIVVVAHGGRSIGPEPTSPVQLSVLRMVPMARAIRRTLRGGQVLVDRPRFQLRGWNGEVASPVHDLTELLDGISRDFGRIPVVLIGHSMGARASLRVAGHPVVTAVAGLAPWLPPGEPVSQLAGRRVLLVHGSDDHTCNPEETWAYAERARSVGQVATIEMRDGDHAMLRRARRWHRLAAEFARLSLALPAGPGGQPAGRGDLAAGNGARPAGNGGMPAGVHVLQAGGGAAAADGAVVPADGAGAPAEGAAPAAGGGPLTGPGGAPPTGRGAVADAFTRAAAGQRRPVL
jgi:predicted alpha/beta hydrolase family esterase